jgi:hypothetical protein
MNTSSSFVGKVVLENGDKVEGEDAVLAEKRKIISPRPPRSLVFVAFLILSFRFHLVVSHRNQTTHCPKIHRI